MNAAVIVLIIILVIGILVGIGIGLYFLLRKNNNDNVGQTGPPNNTPPPSNNPLPPAGNTGTVPPNIVNGIFSINSVAVPSKYLTIGDSINVSQGGNPGLIASADSSIRCVNYAWQNLYNYTPYPGQNSTISSALISNITTLTEGTVTQIIPPYFTIANEFGSSPSTILTRTAYSTDGNNDDVTWNYNAANKTWCAPTPGTFANTCLYLETSGQISSRTFNASDNRFQWNNVPALSSPNCLP